MNRSVRSFNNNQNKSLEHVIIFGRSSRICFNFKTNHTATKQSCPQFPSLIFAKNKPWGTVCVEFVCFVFTFSVTQLPFVTDYLSKYFGRSIYLLDDKVLNELDGYKFGVCVSRYYRWEA